MLGIALLCLYRSLGGFVSRGASSNHNPERGVADDEAVTPFFLDNATDLIT
jgi:hypothetical protein